MSGCKSRLQSARKEYGHAHDGTSQEWGIAEETPIEIGFNGRAWTVMMATPENVCDLALGLAITEGVIKSSADVDECEVQSVHEGITVNLAVAPDRLRGNALARRTLTGLTGCGLCGVERLADAIKNTHSQRGRKSDLEVKQLPTISDNAVILALEGLSDHQPLNSETRTVHAAAWCGLNGEILVVREDVGRHNALDKLVGAVSKKWSPVMPNGFVVMSSRCSFELVTKASVAGAALLATISAPTGLAIDLARSIRLPLVCRAFDRKIMHFSKFPFNEAH